MKFNTPILAFLLVVPSVSAFGNALFQQTPTAQQTFPSKTDGVEIELPDFDELFERVKQVSPLARVAVEGREVDGARGFGAVEKSCKWN